jgi:arylsulfatase
MHVMDIAPTLLGLAGVEHPSKADDARLAQLEGRSLSEVLAGRERSVRSESDWNGWELFGNRAIRQGPWKLMSILVGAGGTGQWQLFNLKDDPAEMHDRAAQHPERRDAMLALWSEYAQAKGVIESDAGPFAPRDHERDP